MSRENHEVVKSGPDAWRAAKTFGDLLVLGRGFVRGNLDWFPGWGSNVLDEESDGIEDALLGANALGMLTVASQPGRPFGPGFDGEIWGGRAFVCGFAAREAAEVLAHRSARCGIWCMADGELHEGREMRETVVGIHAGVPYLVLGPRGRAAELEIFRDALDDSAFTSLQECVYLAIVDASWGRREALERLFETESRVFSDHTNGAHRPS